MTTTATYLCIGCPLGCRLEVEEESTSHALVEVRGFSCRHGHDYAIQEHTAPQRLVTTTVGVEGGLWPRLPVRTSKAVPKAQVLAVCKWLAGIRVQAPVTLGQVIVVDVAGLGCDVIATRDMPAVTESPHDVVRRPVTC